MSAIDRYDDDSAASEGPAEMTDLVSVIIPCYNYAQYLGEAIGSVLSQTYPHVEIIVVDDGSVDDTRDVATRFRGVRYIYQRNQGLSAARNTGLRESRGAFIGFLDADDRLMPDALRIGVEYLYAHPDCAFVSGQVGLIAEDGSLLSTPQETVPGAYHYAELLRHNYIWTLAAVVYRRFVFASIGGFDTSLAACEDYDVSLRIAREFPVGCHGEAVAEYRQHGSNMTRNTAKMMASVFTVLRSQRSFIGGDRSLRRAYEIGTRLYQNMYGSSLFVELEGHMAEKNWTEALRKVAVFLRYYPLGLCSYFVPGFYCGLYGMRQMLSDSARWVKRRSQGRSFGVIKAEPNPIMVSRGSWLGATKLSWAAVKAETVEVRVNAPDGPLLARSGPSGSYATDSWVADRMVFYLQDVSCGLPLIPTHTIAELRVNVTMAGT